MKTNVTLTLTNFSNNSSSLPLRILIKVRQRFSDISLHCRKLDELLLKFVNVLATVIFIVLSLMKTNVTKTLDIL
jgi:hypothetical protein